MSGPLGYNGPFEIIKRYDKKFEILLNGKPKHISIDGSKAAFIESDELTPLNDNSDKQSSPNSGKHTSPMKIHRYHQRKKTTNPNKIGKKC